MPNETAILQYDKYGEFDIQAGGLLEIASATSLAEVVGGLLDGACGENTVCRNSIDAFCINAACHPNFSDVGCISGSNFGCL